jgi:hypothetical protein
MLPKVQDRFEEWLRTPPPCEAAHLRFEARRAPPSGFEPIYDLVDAAFGVRRPRALFDWLYRQNPGGIARCWTVFEKGSGRLLASAADFPWPIARGGEALWGFQRGDAVAAPGFQRRGLSALRGRIHTWDRDYPQEIRIGWPNEKSIGSKRKQGHAREFLGSLDEGAFPLDKTPRSRSWRWLPLLASRGSGLASNWRRVGGGRIRRGRPEPTVEAVTRFDSAFDAATERCMRWRGFWSPHDSAFLNWRYLDHPTRTYHALAALEGDDVAGYAVIRTEGSSALLAEFAAPAQGEVPRGLLRAALEFALESACHRMTFFAPPGWPHWPFFRSAGLVGRSSRRVLWVDRFSPEGPPDLLDWKLVPGDHDTS